MEILERQSFLHQSNLLHQSDLVVEEPLLDNLPFIVPGGNGTKLHTKALSRRLNYFTVGRFHRPFHCAREISDRARVIPLLEHDLVRSISHMVVWKGFEELYGFKVMVMPSSRRLRLTWPVNGDVLSMTLSEGLPQRTFGSSVPSVIQGLHQIS